MLLLVVLGTAAIFSPTLSQPARSDVFDESEYLLPLYRDRNEWGEALERPYKGVGMGGMSDMKMQAMNSKDDLTKEKVLARDTIPTRFSRRQFVIDPIGGGYLLRRQLDSQLASGNIAKKSHFPLDPIGGGYLLKRSAEDGISFDRLYNDLLRMALAVESTKKPAFEERPKRSQGRFVTKEEILATLAADGSFLNSKNLYLLGKGPKSFPIDPIGGGLLLGRSLSLNKDKFISGKANQLLGNGVEHN